MGENVKAGNPQLSTDSTIGLEDIGISRDESSKAQRIAKRRVSCAKNKGHN